MDVEAPQAVALYAVDSGTPARATLPPRVLLHGIGASSDDWEYQIPVFAPHCRVIAPDLRGFGRSPQGMDYTVAAFAADVWALLDRLGVDRFDLVGHSMGGAVALQMAVDRPERLRRLVLADTLPSFVTDTLGKEFMYWYRLVMMWLFGPERLSVALARNMFPAPEQAALRHRMIGHNGCRDRRVYLKTLRALRGWSVSARLKVLCMPALVLAAGNDYFPRGDAEAFAAALPAGRLQIVEDAHHHLPLEAPRRFNVLVQSFLAEGGGHVQSTEPKAVFDRLSGVS